MRLGISSSLAHTSPEDWAQKMQALGCRSVVFPVDCTKPDSVIDAYAAAAKEYDLQIAEVGIWRNALAVKEQERQAFRLRPYPHSAY